MENLASVLDLFNSDDFVFGLFSQKDRGNAIPDFPTLLQEVFTKLVPVEKVIWVDWLRGVLLFSDPYTCLFRTAHDGRDNLRLEFYGRERTLNPMWENLLAHLQENFYLRKRQPWMDGAGGAMGG